MHPGGPGPAAAVAQSRTRSGLMLPRSAHPHSVFLAFTLLLCAPCWGLCKLLRKLLLVGAAVSALNLGRSAVLAVAALHIGLYTGLYSTLHIAFRHTAAAICNTSLSKR
jgi:hypothetical protein